MSTSKTDTLKQELTSFGLNKTEAKIYIYLLQFGKDSGGTNIAYGAEVHRQYVYNSLPHLIELGLVKKVTKGKQSRYLAQPPSQLKKNARKSVLVADELARDLDLISNIGNEQDFEVIQGEKSIQQFEMDSVRSSTGSTKEYIIGGSSYEFEKIMGGSIDTYLSTKETKKIHVKYIGGKTEMENYSKKFGSYENQEYRFIEKLPEGTANMVIREAEVCFFSYAKPAHVYVIKSEAVAQHYKDFFTMLWDMAIIPKKAA